MRFVAFVLSLLGLLLQAPEVAAAGSSFGEESSAPSAASVHTQVRLLPSAATAKPGDTILVGVQLKMDPGWHTYWKSPGEAGQATAIHWQLPPGVTAGTIQWPLPEKLPPLEVTTYGYQKETVLLVPLHLDSTVASGPLALSAKVSWLECQESCLPQQTEVTTTLQVGTETVASSDAALLADWQQRVPPPASNQPFALAAWWAGSPKDEERSLVIAGRRTDNAAKLTPVDLFPVNPDDYEIEAPVNASATADGGFQIVKPVKKFSGNWPTNVSGLVVFAPAAGDHETNRLAWETTLPIGDHPPEAAAGIASSPPPNPSATNPVSAAPEQSLAFILLYAFLGGLILNIMPCVLPVIALKILGFVNESKSQPQHIRVLGGIYALGVLMSFLVLAGVVIGLQSAGRLVGWGVQFSSPAFVISLTTLVTLVALNLFGLFEVTLGDSASGVAGNLSTKRGAAGAFFNGVLATALATPCTAPFLGYALGFAFAQPAPVIILVFLTAGLGLASPYVVLSWNPGWLKFLPKPGAWMEKFKVAMGFPVLASAFWLFTLAADDLSKTGLLRFGLFLVALGFAAWIWGEFVQRGSKRRPLAMLTSLALIGGTGAYAWHEPVENIVWQPWSASAVDAARAAGKPVLVDFTADWCLTCQVNKKTSIEVPSVETRLRELGVAAFVGDYTHSPEVMTAELRKYHRAGVPLVLVFPAKADQPAIILPEVLTPGLVLNALNAATHPGPQ